MTHLGQRLSALIDGELDASERERVLIHMARCGSCRDEVAALRMLKRRMSALGEAAAGAAGAALTGRLIGLSESVLGGRMPVAEAAWPVAAPAGGWHIPSQGNRADQRVGKYFVAGSLIVFLAGLGTAAFIAGGEPQAQAPSSPATPSVDVAVFPQRPMNAPGSRTDDRDHSWSVSSATPSRLP
jgi:anti-sigma factor RsiW